MFCMLNRKRTRFSSNPLEKPESIKQTKTFNKASAQGEIESADEGRTKLQSLITSRRPSVSSGASQHLCYQHGLPQRRQSPRQPRSLQLAPDKVGCAASEAEHSTGTHPEFPTLLCVAFSGVTYTALSLRPHHANTSPSETMEEFEFLQLLSTHSAAPKDLDESLFESSFLQ